MEKIQFATNQVVELSLKFAEGKECQSNFGPPQWMFTTTDERVFFVAEKVAAKIHGLRLQPGEPFELCKAEVPYTNGRKGIEWQVNKVGFAPGEEPAPIATAGQQAAKKFWAGKTIGEQPDGTFAVPAIPSGAGVSAPAPAARAASQPPVSNGNGSKSNGKPNGNGNGHTTIHEPPMPWALFLLNQTKALIDVYAMACAYAGEKHGNTVKADDVRSIMLSAFINVSKNGGANVA